MTYILHEQLRNESQLAVESLLTNMVFNAVKLDKQRYIEKIAIETIKAKI